MISATPSPSMPPGMYYGTVILTDTDGQAVLISCTLTVTAAAPTQTTSVLPQVAFDGGWYSWRCILSNVTGTAAALSSEFCERCKDYALECFPLDRRPPVSPTAYGTAIIEAPDGGGATVNQGYAEFTLPSGVQGYGVFRQAGQEAVVPFSQGNATSNTLTFDDTGPLVTSVAIVNPSSVPANVVITLWSDAGAIIGTSSVPLAANTKTEKELRGLPGLSGMAGKRGTAQFAVSSGNVAVLGLRTFSTGRPLRPSRRPAPPPRIPDRAFFRRSRSTGAGIPALYFSNPTGTAVSFPVKFVSDAGTPLNVPTGSSTQVSLAANGTAIIEAPDGGGNTVNEGIRGVHASERSVRLRSVPAGGPGGGGAVLPRECDLKHAHVRRHRPAGHECGDRQPKLGPCQRGHHALWSDAGTIIGTSSVPLAANTKTEKELRGLPGLSGMVGKRGTAQFAVSSGNVAVLGLRFNGAAFTSIPTTNP